MVSVSWGWTFFQGQGADHVGLLSPKCLRRFARILDMQFTFVHDQSTYLAQYQIT
jgi:hypothetical protein